MQDLDVGAFDEDELNDLQAISMEIGPSVKQQRKTAQTQFLIFLENHYEALEQDTKNLVLRACKDIDPPKFDSCADIPLNIMPRNLFDCYFSFLASTATQLVRGKKKSTKLYSWQSTQTILSQTKQFFCHEHPESKRIGFQPPYVFQTGTWGQLRAAMSRVIKIRVRKAGQKLKQSKQTLSDEDMVIMALIMLRAGKNDFVILCAYTAMLASIGSRASETAALTFEHLEVLKYTNDYQHCDLFQVELCRDKTIHTQKPRIFPMAYDNNWFKDIYFMLALLMIYRCAGKYQETVIEDTSPIFPKFYEESKKEKKKADKKDSKGNSLVSKFFGDIYKEITKFFDDIDIDDPLLADDARLNPKISSHSGKRKAAQWLAELCVSTFSALYRLGYLLHSVSSFIECNYFLLSLNAPII